MSDHAKLAPSSAHRWLVCHGSVELCARAPKRDSIYAREGTLAHAVAAQCLEQRKNAATFLGTKDESGELTVTQEMVDHVNDYVDFIDSLVLMWGGTPLIETRVKLTELIWGTADIILLSADGETLHVADFKYGQGKIVEVEGNYQALTYALGALKHLGPVAQAKVKTVHVHIFQPRAGGEPWRDWEISRAGLDTVENELLEAQRMIQAGSRVLKTGPHCTFCDAAATCPARGAEANDAARDVFSNNSPPPIATLTMAQITRIIELTPRVEEWLKAVHDHAKRLLELGETVPGYKLIDKIGNRRWTDPDATGPLLAMEGIDPYEKKLISPAEAERRLAKTNRKVDLGSLVERPVTGQAMVPVSNPTPAANIKAVFPKER